MTTRPPGPFVRGLERIQDPAAKEAVRDLANRVGAIENATTEATDFSAIRTALQRGGSTPLNVTGLLGKLGQSQPGLTGRTALWYQIDTSIAGAGNYVWEREVINLAPDHYMRGSSQEQVVFKTGGVYIVAASLQVSTSATLSLLHNTVAVARGVGTLVSLAAVIMALSGERVSCSNSTGNRVGNADGRTRLGIARLA